MPIEKALDDVLVALYQNGEPIRPGQGYPMRLFCPGWEGNISVKWLTQLKLMAAPAQFRDETSKYTDTLPDRSSLQFTFPMGVKSLITSPSGQMNLPRPGVYPVTGIAWSGHGAIRRVEVSADGGRTWAEAMLQAEPLPRALGAVHDSLAMVRRRGGAAKPRHRQRRQCPAAPRRSARGKGHDQLLSQQLHSELGRGRRRSGQQCLCLARRPGKRAAPLSGLFGGILGGALAAAAITLAPAAGAQEQAARVQLGEPISEDQLLGFDLIATPDGSGMPPGAGTARQGREVYALNCLRCHSAEGEGVSAITVLAGGDMNSEARRCAPSAASGPTRAHCSISSAGRCRPTRRKR